VADFIFHAAVAKFLFIVFVCDCKLWNGIKMQLAESVMLIWVIKRLRLIVLFKYASVFYYKRCQEKRLQGTSLPDWKTGEKLGSGKLCFQTTEGNKVHRNCAAITLQESVIC